MLLSVVECGECDGVWWSVEECVGVCRSMMDCGVVWRCVASVVVCDD